MNEIYEERKYKIERIIEEYDKRKTQMEVAEIFHMNPKHVSWVTQQNDYKHTRKITPENIKEGESISPIIEYEEFEYLDQYPIENFRKTHS